MKQVAPYLRHLKPPYTVHPYSPVLAQRKDMVPWYDPPKVVRMEPIATVIAPEIEDRPANAMDEAAFIRHAQETAKIDALKEAHSDDPFSADKRGMTAVEYDMQEQFAFEEKPETAMSEDEFAKLAEVVAPEEPPAEHVMPKIDMPVEGTPAGNAAKRHGQPTRKMAAIDKFDGVTPREMKASPFARPAGPAKL